MANVLTITASNARPAAGETVTITATAVIDDLTGASGVMGIQANDSAGNFIKIANVYTSSHDAKYVGPPPGNPQAWAQALGTSSISWPVMFRGIETLRCVIEDAGPGGPGWLISNELVIRPLYVRDADASGFTREAVAAGKDNSATANTDTEAATAAADERAADATAKDDDGIAGRG